MCISSTVHSVEASSSFKGKYLSTSFPRISTTFLPINSLLRKTLFEAILLILSCSGRIIGYTVALHLWRLYN